VLPPARLRMAPDTEADIITMLPGGTRLVVGGITEDGIWVLVRVFDAELDVDGEVGWISLQLLEIEGDLETLLLFTSEGQPLAPPEVVETPLPEEPVAEPTPEDIETPIVEPTLEDIETPIVEPTPGEVETPVEEPVETPAPEEEVIELPTPAPTPVERDEVGVTPAPPPLPEAGEIVATVVGTDIPANPFEPITLVTDDGFEFAIELDVTDDAQVQIWSGILADAEGAWLPARGELLWPGVRVYMLAELDGEDLLEPERLRIVAPPAEWQRLRLFAVPRFATALLRGELMSLLVTEDDPALYLLETDDDFTRIWERGLEVVAVQGGAGGTVIPSSSIPSGVNSFVYIGNDGIAVEVQARPFQNLQGIAGDAEGNLWWIETPQVAFDQWQLWRFDRELRQVVLELQLPLSILAEEGTLLQPALVDVQVSDTEIVLLIDTADLQAQQIHSGVFRLTIPRALDDEVEEIDDEQEEAPLDGEEIDEVELPVEEETGEAQEAEPITGEAAVEEITAEEAATEEITEPAAEETIPGDAEAQEPAPEEPIQEDLVAEPDLEETAAEEPAAAETEAQPEDPLLEEIAPEAEVAEEATPVVPTDEDPAQEEVELETDLLDEDDLPFIEETEALTPTVTGPVIELVLPAGAYRSPLRVSPAGDRLAYFSYDPDHPSLTAGIVRPPNRLWVLPLTDLAEAEPVMLYETETRFEFLPPNLVWRSNDELLLARSRFLAEGVFGLERFGIVYVSLAEDGEPVVVSHLLPAGNVLEDFAVCQQDNSILMVVADQAATAVEEDRSSWLEVWPVVEDPQLVRELPVYITRIQACWQVPQ
jgi:hypothetical protein